MASDGHRVRWVSRQTTIHADLSDCPHFLRSNSVLAHNSRVRSLWSTGGLWDKTRDYNFSIIQWGAMDTWSAEWFDRRLFIQIMGASCRVRQRNIYKLCFRFKQRNIVLFLNSEILLAIRNNLLKCILQILANFLPFFLNRARNKK